MYTEQYYYYRLVLAVQYSTYCSTVLTSVRAAFSDDVFYSAPPFRWPHIYFYGHPRTITVHRRKEETKKNLPEVDVVYCRSTDKRIHRQKDCVGSLVELAFHMRCDRRRPTSNPVILSSSTYRYRYVTCFDT